MALYRESNVISETSKRNLRWLGHAKRIPEEKTAKKMLKNIPEGKDLLESHEKDAWTMLKMV
jgi:hypothetical protein